MVEPRWDPCATLRFGTDAKPLCVHSDRQFVESYQRNGLIRTPLEGRHVTSHLEIRTRGKRTSDQKSIGKRSVTVFLRFRVAVGARLCFAADRTDPEAESYFGVSSFVLLRILLECLSCRQRVSR